MKKFLKCICLILVTFCFVQISVKTSAAQNFAEITGVKAVSNGVKLTWNRIPETDIYIIYRKEGSGDFQPVQAVKDSGKSRQSFTDNTVKCKTKYSYLVADGSSVGFYKCMGTTHYQYGGNNIIISFTWRTQLNADLYLAYLDGVFYESFPKGTDSFTVEQKWDGYSYPPVTVYPLYAAAIDSEEEAREVKTSSLKKSVVKKVQLVATGRACIKWTRSGMADGYIVYRRSGKNWKKLTEVKDNSRTYCYDNSAKKGTWYYTVKAYQIKNGKKVYASWNKTGKKAVYKGKKITPKKGNYNSGTVYGPSMGSSQRTAVKKQVTRFFTKYITSDMTNLEKVLTAQLYLKETCVYASTWSKNGANTAWGALVYKNSSGLHEAQCSGFSRAFVALCDAMGIPCRYVHANSRASNPEHQWCFVKLSGKWYVIDPQGNATNGDMMQYVLLGGEEYKSMTGLRWNEDSFPAISKKGYSYAKIQKALNGYRVQSALKKIKKYR